MVRLKLFVLKLSLAFITLSVCSQETLVNIQQDADFVRGTELYKKEKYSTAQQFFEAAYNRTKDENSEIRSLAQFYIAGCAVRLFNEDAEYLTFKFVSDNPENPLVNEAWFNLGGYFYARKKWQDAIEYYLKVKPDDLTRDQWSEYFFKLGYSYFSDNDSEKAKIAFYHIKDIDTKYTPPALYYYSHIHYEEKNYQTALEGFLRLTKDPTFGAISPYYIVQIYYMQGRYKEIVDFAPGIMKNVTDKRLAEVARITAEAFAQLGRYSESLPYYKTFLDSADYVRKEDKYQAGYANYKAGEYQSAIAILGSISSVDSQLGQNAAYYLADCYLKTGDKQDARLAFQSASRGDFDPSIRQDALFNYALITYELSNDPFNEAIRAFEDFIRQYPESKRIDEAYRFLIQSYLNARNYRLALESIEKSPVKSNELKTAYQKIAYYRGVELFNNLDYRGAVQHFDKSLLYADQDQLLKARALYWKGESYYRMNDYTKAIACYNDFKNAQVAYTLDEYKLIDYNLGYALFKQKNYAGAKDSFRKFCADAASGLDKEKADGYNRIGDCFYAQKDYASASDFYNRAASANVNDAEYALLQKGICQGLANNDIQKIQTLQDMVSSHPGSAYADDALYEIAQSYLKIQNTDRAIENLKRIISEFPQSNYTPSSYVQLGLLSYNTDRNDQAITYYKEVVKRFPGTQAARDALYGLKNVYVDMNRVDDYFAYVNGLGSSAPNISASEQDSLSYASAEKLYMSGNCSESAPAFEKYISNYPKGHFLLNAHYYEADCNLRAKENDKAYTSFSYILQLPANIYTEEALMGSARIEMDRKQYQQAIDHYNQILSNYSNANNTKEASIGLMRAYYTLKQYEDAIRSARIVQSTPKISPETEREATYVIARSLQETGRDLPALEDYKKISGEVMSREGAEAKFRVAELLNKTGDSKGAEQEILDFSEKSSPHEYWIARSFILWADIFTSKKQYFQAIQTLQSIIDYYESTTDGIMDMAKSRKAENVKLQEANEQPSGHDDVEINIQ
jgi:TolA-binding protein